MKKIRILITMLLYWAVTAQCYAQSFVKQNNKGQYGIVNAKGKIIPPYDYGKMAVTVYPLSAEIPNLAKVHIAGKELYIDKDGQIVNPADYNAPISTQKVVQDLTPKKNESTGGTLTPIRVGKKCGFADESGTIIIPCTYKWVGCFSEGLAPVRIHRLFGYIDTSGSLVISADYYGVEKFSEGFARVRKNGYWGYIDKTGNLVIPYQYFYAEDFSNGLATVQVKRKFVSIDKTGTVVNPTEQRVTSENNVEVAQVQVPPAKEEKSNELQPTILFVQFAKNYVEPQINEWQQKGEYEKTVYWQQRVNEDTRKVKVAELFKEAEQAYLTEFVPKMPIGSMTIGVYDADNEVYLIENSVYGNLLLPVPIEEAKAFKKEWETCKRMPQFVINNDKLELTEMIFSTASSKHYKYSNQASLNYSTAQITYNFAPLDAEYYETFASQTAQGSQTISTTNISVGKSDVDINIPTTSGKNNKTFAIIIANENYKKESKVEFAHNDGETFKKYCVQTLGIPETNIHFAVDATLNEMRSELDWIHQVANAYNGEANILFYYAGHGIPDESSKSAYLLPIDGYGSSVQSAYKLDDLYKQLGAMPTQTVTVFMDACFSGAQRSGTMLASARGVAIKVTPSEPTGNMVVFSAAQGNETAYPYREKGHGMFTYYVLKKLQESNGEVTLGELSEYVTKQVGQQSIVVNGKSQTPTVVPSAIMEVQWKGQKLK
ncbi:MAG: WG repeat-containing protein [Bacteroidales bacterium]|jgi:hypothetical protein|nr:WG repeat-containing protein [Bacteroidales bacterium]